MMGMTQGLLLRLLFWISGIAALMYQVAWERLLVLAVGGDVTSITIIVSAFMAGLGLGSLAGAAMADRLSPRHCLLGFALAEAVIAMLGWGSGPLFHEWLYPWMTPFSAERWKVSAVLFVCLLPPTFLMGLSLPLLARVPRLGGGAVADRIAGLYGANTLGAATGAFLATWVVMPQWGIDGTLAWAASANALCAVLMMPLLLQAARHRGTEPSSLTPHADAGHERENPDELWPCLGLFVVSGFVALGFELLWFRLLGAMSKTSAVTLGNLLGIYLLSLGLGAMAGGRLLRWVRRPRQAYGQLLGLSVLWGCAGLALFLQASQHWSALAPVRRYLDSYEPLDANTAIDWWRIGAAPTLSEDSSIWMFPIMHWLLPLVLMGPTLFLMGAGYPLLQRAAQTRGREVGRRTGLLQAANILGCLLGSVGVGYGLLELGGSAVTLALLAVAGGAVWLVSLDLQRRGWVKLTAVGGLMLGVVGTLPDQTTLWAQIHGTSADRVIIAEDSSGVSLMKKSTEDAADPHQWMVYAGGIGQSWIPYGGIHSLLGALPVILHPDPKKLMIIGLGSGDTLYAMQARAETQEVACVEIVAAQHQSLEALAGLSRYSGAQDVLRDPRTRWVHGDGRFFLRTQTDTRWDIIEADAMRPNSARAGVLYSQEYFALAASRLKPGGYFVTWVPTERVAATLLKTFPHLTLFGGVIGIATHEPLKLDTAAIQRRLADPAVIRHFQRAGIHLESLLAPMLGRESSIHSFGPSFDRSLLPAVNTDRFPRDELELPALWGKRE